MSDFLAFANLRNILADLYSDVPSAQRIVDDAGVDRALISFSSKPIDNWHAILREAARQNQIDSLITVVTKDYGSNDDLRRATESFRTHVTPDIQTSNFEASTTIDPMPSSANLERTIHSEAAEREHPTADEASGQIITDRTDGYINRGTTTEDVDEAPKISPALLTVWFPILGAVTLILTIAFIMWLVQAGRDLSETQAFLTILIVSLTAAATTFFLGGWAKAQGAITIPWLSDDPVKFATTGGIAAFVIVLVVATSAYKVLVVLREPSKSPAVEQPPLQSIPLKCDTVHIEKFWVRDQTSVPVTPDHIHAYPIESATGDLVVSADVILDPDGCDSSDTRYAWVAHNVGNEKVFEATGKSINYPIPSTPQDQIVELTATLLNADLMKDSEISASFTVRFIR